MIELKSNNVYCIGDTHGIYNTFRAIKNSPIEDCLLLHVGDFGIGFSYEDYNQLINLNSYLANKNIRLLIIRGNHDNPIYFQGKNKIHCNNTHIEFLEDYSEKKINDRTFLFVGGGISIDRINRDINESYWIDEKVVLKEDYKNLPHYDFLITHSVDKSCPVVVGFKAIKYWLDLDKSLEADLVEERENLFKLIEHVKPKFNIFGHFHKSFRYEENGRKYIGLDINEILDITKYTYEEKTNN